MAYEISNYSVKITLVAAADLSAKQYYLVKINTSGEVALCAAATDKPIGVLQNTPTAGQEAQVLVIGGTKIVCSASLDEGTAIGTTSAGKAGAKTVGTDTTNYIVGQIILAGGADLDIATAVINCASPARAA